MTKTHPTLLGLSSRQCRWPVNDVPRGGTFLFCGEPATDDIKYCYCAAHLAQAYVVRAPKGKSNEHVAKNVGFRTGTGWPSRKPR